MLKMLPVLQKMDHSISFSEKTPIFFYEFWQNLYNIGPWCLFLRPQSFYLSAKTIYTHIDGSS
jgi:hypothetical protein